MKHALILLLILVSVQLQAQKTYSITLDADNDQFFSVAIGKKNYPSSSIGHLVIPGLKDSVYQLLISFPRSTFTAESFTVSIEKSDRKFQLKKVGDKQWNLQDIQTNAWVKQKAGSNQLASVSNEAELKRSREAFKKLMAAVVNDTAILSTEYETPAPKKELIAKKEPEKLKIDIDSVAKTKVNVDTVAVAKIIPIAQKADSIVKDVVIKSDAKKETNTDNSTTLPTDRKKGSDSAAKNSLIDTVSIQKPTEKVDTRPVEKEVITKLSEQTKENEKELIFLTRDSAGAKDTVSIVIPIEREKQLATPVIDTAVTVRDTVSKKLDSVMKKPDPIMSDSSKSIEKTDSSKKIVIINSDCRNFATEADLDRLRVKMISENRLEERIVVAKKVFKTRCFTTRQIRALSELFVSDKTRYEFFDAAYPFVSDTSNFKSLLDLFTDEYYIGRFKAMVRISDSR